MDLAINEPLWAAPWDPPRGRQGLVTAVALPGLRRRRDAAVLRLRAHRGGGAAGLRGRHGWWEAPAMLKMKGLKA